MNGYTELLLMHRKMDESGINFIEMVRKSIHSMRQLIDDLLDLAKIETGIQLNFKPVEVEALVGECIDLLQPVIMSKDMNIKLSIPEDSLSYLRIGLGCSKSCSTSSVTP